MLVPLWPSDCSLCSIVSSILHPSGVSASIELFRKSLWANNDEQYQKFQSFWWWVYSTFYCDFFALSSLSLDSLVLFARIVSLWFSRIHKRFVHAQTYTQTVSSGSIAATNSMIVEAFSSRSKITLKSIELQLILLAHRHTQTQREMLQMDGWSVFAWQKKVSASTSARIVRECREIGLWSINAIKASMSGRLQTQI